MRDTLKRLGLLVIIAGSFLLGNWAFHGAQPQERNSAADSTLAAIHLFNEIMVKLNRHYVNDIPSAEMTQKAIDSAMNELDPHTSYFTEDEFTRFQDDTAGHFGGIGVTIQSINDTITVMSVTPGEPAWNAGIVAGDRFLSVDGEALIGFTSDEAVQTMRGEVGTHMQLTVQHPGETQSLQYDLFRDDVRIDSVPYAFIFDDAIGYMRLQQFNANAASELRVTLERFFYNGVRSLIIDLRSNPGGLLSEAIDTVGELIGPDMLVVSTRGRLPMYNQSFYTRNEGYQPDWPIIVLINEASASAAEIFAGALQDYDRALIMGETSFGKGSVQQLFPLSQGGMKLTTSYYYIPSGRCIHKSANDDLLRGRAVDSLNTICQDEEVFTTQGGRVVQGGGGVSPDVTTSEVASLSSAARKLRIDNMFFHYCTRIARSYEEPPAQLSAEQVQDFFNQHASRYYADQDDLANDRLWLETELQATWREVTVQTYAGQRLRTEIDPLVKQARELLQQADTQAQLFAAAGVESGLFTINPSISR